MDYVLITNKNEMAPYFSDIMRSKVLAIDTETTGLDPHASRIRLIQLAADNLPVLVIDCFSFLPEGACMLRDILENHSVKIFQNAKFDLQFFMALGIQPSPIFDTMLASQILRSSGGPQRANLAALAKHYLHEDISKEEQKSDWSGALTETQLRYAALDAELLPRLREILVKDIYENNLAKVALIEFACVSAISEMEFTGISLDTQRWGRLAAQTEKEKGKALEILYAYAGKPVEQLDLWGGGISLNQNFESNQYILSLLRANGIAVGTTSKRDLSAYSGHPLIKALTAYRKAAKALSSFLYPMPQMINPKTGRLHPHYGQIGAWSGRMSCGEPNIQQIPRDSSFRACFIAPPGRKLVIADYSQIELRVAAQVSQDSRMIAAYRGGEDLHTLTASLISDIPASAVTKSQRQAAKAVNFGLIYGMGAAGLRQYARQSYGTEMTLEQAAKFRDSFFKAYPGITGWHQRIKEDRPTEERSLTGRKFVFDQNSGAAGLYNTPVQGTAADILKSAMGALIRRTMGTNIKIIAVVHDEILLESDEDEANMAAAMLKAVMECAGNEIMTSVPCVADVKTADSWAEK